MTKRMRFVVIALLLLLGVYAVFTWRGRAGGKEQLARSYCSRCHLYPEPGLLDRQTWTEKVLPKMGLLAGIKYFNGEPYVDVYALEHNTDSTEFPAAAIALDEWKAITSFYQHAAPDSIPAQARPPITIFTNRFGVAEVDPPKGESPATAFLQIDPGNHWIFAGDACDSTLQLYNSQLQLLSQCKLSGIALNIDFSDPLALKGPREGILTLNGGLTAAADSFAIDPNGKLGFLKKMDGQMANTIQTTVADIDLDGRPDYLVCGCGKPGGMLYWLHNLGHGHFEKRIIQHTPGTVKAVVQDFNNDGLPDIMALMSRGKEGIYLFLNKGNGMFSSKTLMEFPPVFGSSSFDLADFNRDGRPDILYTCGDSSHVSPHLLKPYHGLYIFLNEGGLHFRKAYFFPVHGCYKALARDFDNDGDLDIASIAYYPDRNHQQQESFVYLENKGDLKFKPFGIRQYFRGDWRTLDAGDVDGDGDEDIVIGSLIHDAATWKPFGHPLHKTAPSFLLLRNNTISP